MRTYLLGLMLACTALVAGAQTVTATDVGNCSGDFNALDDDGVRVRCFAGVTSCTVSGLEYGEVAAPRYSCNDVLPVCICQVPDVGELTDPSRLLP